MLDSGRLLVATLFGSIYSVDLSTGDRTVITNVSGAPTNELTGWTSDGAGVMFGADVRLGAVIAIDTVTGEAVITSK